MADVRLYIEYRNSHQVMLPVNPEKLEITSPGTNSTTNTVNLGDINLLKLRGLSTLSFESFTPSRGAAGSYAIKDANLQPADFYVKFFQAIQEQREPINFVVSGLNVSIKMAVESFKYWWEGQDPDMHYGLSLKEYRDYAVKEVSFTYTPRPSAPIQPQVVFTPRRANTAKKVAVGSKVIVNGRLYKSSYGDSPGMTERNATRIVNFINRNAPYPYHVATLNGGWRGWVSASSVEVIE